MHHNDQKINENVSRYKRYQEESSLLVGTDITNPQNLALFVDINKIEFLVNHHHYANKKLPLLLSDNPLMLLIDAKAAKTFCEYNETFYQLKKFNSWKLNIKSTAAEKEILEFAEEVLNEAREMEKVESDHQIKITQPLPTINFFNEKNEIKNNKRSNIINVDSKNATDQKLKKQKIEIDGDKISIKQRYF